MDGTCGTYGRQERCMQGFPEGKRPLGRPRRRWENDIKMDVQKVELEGGQWT